MENVRGVRDVNAWDLRRGFDGLRQAEHALENWGSEAEGKSVDAEFFPI